MKKMIAYYFLFLKIYHNLNKSLKLSVNELKLIFFSFSILRGFNWIWISNLFQVIHINLLSLLGRYFFSGRLRFWRYEYRLLFLLFLFFLYFLHFLHLDIFSLIILILSKLWWVKINFFTIIWYDIFQLKKL